jgi:2-polyprenyl-3-methyl-5-hydroxy-6-metoxy-1,4-benzoquinol methylase
MPVSDRAFTEDDIRPHRFDEGKAAALQRDLAWLAQRASTFIVVACPACGSNDQEPAFEKFGFRFVRCKHCRTAYMNPRATAATLGEFYARSTLYEFWNQHIFPASREVRREKIFRPRAERIAALCTALNVPTDVLVEVGAANGIFCEEVMRSGAFRRVVAIEPGHSLATSCRALGIETIASSVEEVGGLDGTANVVASFETIEHLFSPRDFIVKCHRLLVENGLLVLTCPNYEGFDIQTLGVDSDSLDAEHVNLFNPDALASLVERCGFRVTECSTPGELDAEIVHRKATEGGLDLSSQSFLKTVLVERWGKLGARFQEFLKANGLSSHLWLVAQRLR